ncbi:hypothetical protein [Nitrosomonas sp. Nm33]|uniref:hypothetical protein n=2 Tax=unclassified Nitrosomonas TaxID=2609265 RepID=UPI000898C9C2|nr:hypothetical protein [Nitrosomonas sp. Nm33]SDY41165.1 hypothetical protein SAMN05421755_10219 [Nitrosomonas sp. Nm33]
MRRLSNISILTLSIGLTSAPALARQIVNSSDYATILDTQIVHMLLQNLYMAADDLEARRVGKLL